MVLSNRTLPALHNAAWPGVVGKQSQGGTEPDIGLEQMLDLTAKAEVNGAKFDGIDLFLYPPHFDLEAADDGSIKALAEQVQRRGLVIGSVVAPVWFYGNAMGEPAKRAGWLNCVTKTVQVAEKLRQFGARPYGVVRIDSAVSVAEWATEPIENIKRIAHSFQDAAAVAKDHGERLAAEGEICWGGMHSWRHMLYLLEAVDRRNYIGFQADLAHTYLYLLGHNALEYALLKSGYTADEFWPAYETMTNTLRPWTIDVHIAQNDGTVHGSGSHDKTGRHCMVDDPNGKLDIVRCAGYWLQGAERRGISHICWDGCMFPNAVLEDQATWDKVLATMLQVREAHGSYPRQAVAS